jgi:multidrug efflux system outer membrane protein
VRGRLSRTAVLITLLLGGCNLAPPYQQPPAPIPSAYPEQSAATGQAASDVAWQNFFGDPQLKAYIGAAFWSRNWARAWAMRAVAADRSRLFSSAAPI